MESSPDAGPRSAPMCRHHRSRAPRRVVGGWGATVMTPARTRGAGDLANRAARLFNRSIDRRLRRHGITSGLLPVFLALEDGGALTQKDLARLAAIEQPTMAATLARMERDGLITRRPDPNDRRRVLISLHPAAMERAAAVREAVGEVNAAALSGLTPDEQVAFLGMIGKVIAAFDTLSDA